MTRQISFWVKMASPVTTPPDSGSVLSNSSAAVISLLSGQLQLADHAAQGIAEGCQQMHARRRGRGTAAQALAVNGDVSRRATAPHPGPKCGFKARHIQALE